MKEGKSFFYNLVDAVVDAYGHFFTELKPCRDKIAGDQRGRRASIAPSPRRLFNRKTESLLKEGKTSSPAAMLSFSRAPWASRST